MAETLVKSFTVLPSSNGIVVTSRRTDRTVFVSTEQDPKVGVIVPVPVIEELVTTLRKAAKEACAKS